MQNIVFASSYSTFSFNGSSGLSLEAGERRVWVPHRTHFSTFVIFELLVIVGNYKIRFINLSLFVLEYIFWHFRNNFSCLLNTKL